MMKEQTRAETIRLKAEEGKAMPELKISYKPQILESKSMKTVRDVIYEKLGKIWTDPVFQTEVMRPMKLEDLLEHTINTLSGGELQRLAIVLCLGKPANIYLLDEPSAYLDVEQRIVTAKMIKRFMLNQQKPAFIVEHDFIMASYLANEIIVFEGQPGVKATAFKPVSLANGMNRFLAQLGITMRRDPTNYRPRVNKLDSAKDKEQKESGTYFVQE